MTGSGSTIVAYFSNKKSAINALKLAKKILKIIGVFYQKLYKAFLL